MSVAIWDACDILLGLEVLLAHIRLHGERVDLKRVTMGCHHSSQLGAVLGIVQAIAKASDVRGGNEEVLPASRHRDKRRNLPIDSRSPPISLTKIPSIYFFCSFHLFCHSSARVTHFCVP